MKKLKALKNLHILKKIEINRLKGGGVIETIDNIVVDID